MPNETITVATQFVDLALKHKHWDRVTELPVDEVRVLFATVAAAGFDPREVKRGELKGHYLDDDGRRMVKTHPIQVLCPFKVVGREGDDYFATGWLDCALRRVVHGSTRQNESREKLIEVMAEEIERSVPLVPIQLTPEGDLLREYPPSTLAFGLEYFVKHTRDENDLDSCVGVHEFCNSWMDRRRATSTHDAIVCRGCYLRVLFPREVRTYGELRQALASQHVQVPA